MLNIMANIGNTPLINVNSIYIKLEYFNPSGSIKDRAIKFMLLGELLSDKPPTKDTIFIEASSGNTGISLAMICAAKGYKCMVIVPSNTTDNKIKLMKSFGARVLYSKSIADGQKFCRLLTNRSKLYKDIRYLNQFTNKWNVIGQEKIAWEALHTLFKHEMQSYKDICPDAVIAGCGTAGTLQGLANVVRLINPKCKVYKVVPKEYNDEHGIEGICDNVETPLLTTGVTKTVTCSTQNAVDTMKAMHKRGIMCGISSGANYWAACQIAHDHKKVLTVFSDGGLRYL